MKQYRQLREVFIDEALSDVDRLAARLEKIQRRIGRDMMVACFLSAAMGGILAGVVVWKLI